MAFRSIGRMLASTLAMLAIFAVPSVAVAGESQLCETIRQNWPGVMSIGVYGKMRWADGQPLDAQTVDAGLAAMSCTEVSDLDSGLGGVRHFVVEYPPLQGYLSFTNPVHRIHVMEIDLDHEDITLTLSPDLAGEYHLEEHAAAHADDIVAGINGSYGHGTEVRGYTMSDGTEYGDTGLCEGIAWHSTSNNFNLIDGCGRAIVEGSPPSPSGDSISVAGDQAVSGCGWLVSSYIGQDVPPCSNNDYHWKTHARAMFGVDEDGPERWAFMAVADRKESDEILGLEYLEAAQFMLLVGTKHAVNLDGAGSAQLYVRGAAPADRDIVNDAFNGGAHPVPNGVFIHHAQAMPSNDSDGAADDPGIPTTTAGSRGGDAPGCRIHGEPIRSFPWGLGLLALACVRRRRRGPPLTEQSPRTRGSFGVMCDAMRAPGDAVVRAPQSGS